MRSGLEVENKEEFCTDLGSSLGFLNTFEKITHAESCSHESALNSLLHFKAGEVPDKTLLPLQVMVFENREICRDALSLLYHSLSQISSNGADREKMKKVLLTLFRELLEVSPYRIKSACGLKDFRIQQIVMMIEKKLFHQSFSFLSASAQRLSD